MGVSMKRESCKFLSGSFAALAVTHAAYATAVSATLTNGRRPAVEGETMAQAASG
jgi:hypothetical protein